MISVSIDNIFGVGCYSFVFHCWTLNQAEYIIVKELNQFVVVFLQDSVVRVLSLSFDNRVNSWLGSSGLQQPLPSHVANRQNVCLINPCIPEPKKIGNAGL
jgi:hypothetical protein